MFEENRGGAGEEKTDDECCSWSFSLFCERLVDEICFNNVGDVPPSSIDGKIGPFDFTIEEEGEEEEKGEEKGEEISSSPSLVPFKFFSSPLPLVSFFILCLAGDTASSRLCGDESIWL